MTPQPQSELVSGVDEASTQHKMPGGGKGDESAKQGQSAPSAGGKATSSALVALLVPRLLKTRKITVRKSNCKAADFGLGEPSKATAAPSPNPVPAHQAPMSQDQVETNRSRLDDSATMVEGPHQGEAMAAPEGGDALLMLKGPKIPTCKPILPPPLDCSHIPLARLVHLDGISGV